MELNKLKKNYPNYDDKGHSYLLSGESWLRVREYNNVLNELRTLYQISHNSPELAHAKLLEGETYEKILNSKSSRNFTKNHNLAPQSTDTKMRAMVFFTDARY